MNQPVVFLSDGGDTLRDFQTYWIPESEHILDWFQITTGSERRSTEHLLSMVSRQNGETVVTKGVGIETQPPVCSTLWFTLRIIQPIPKCVGQNYGYRRSKPASFYNPTESSTRRGHHRKYFQYNSLVFLQIRLDKQHPVTTFAASLDDHFTRWPLAVAVLAAMNIDLEVEECKIKEIFTALDKVTLPRTDLT